MSDPNLTQALVGSRVYALGFRLYWVEGVEVFLEPIWIRTLVELGVLWALGLGSMGLQVVQCSQSFFNPIRACFQLLLKP